VAQTVHTRIKDRRPQTGVARPQLDFLLIGSNELLHPT
jgi:hypothetical protein